MNSACHPSRRLPGRARSAVARSFVAPGLVAVALFAVLATGSIQAQSMPDISMMAGTPLAAPELPDASVSVRVVRQQLGNNVANHPVTLKGAKVTKTVNTDAQGRATFTGIEVGTVVTATTEVDGETLQSQEFDVPAKGGVRVALVAGVKAMKDSEQAAAAAAAKEPPRQGMVVFGGETRVIFEFQDDNLNAFYILDIVNGARTPIDTGAPLVLELPRGAVGAAALEGSSPLASVQGTRVTITGPFPPGTTAVQVAFTLPYDSDTLTVQQAWPAPLEEAFVAIERVGALKLASPQLSEVQEAEASGTKFLMGRGPRLNADQPMAITLSGLPHYNQTVRYLGIAIGLAIIAVGMWAAFTSAPARKNEAAKLAARREKLFAELVDLERQRKAGRIDEARYESKRQHLTTQLERILGELDRSPASGGEGVAA